MPIVPGTSTTTPGSAGTVGALIDRGYRDWLELPDELWTRTVLTADVDEETTTWPVDLGLLAFEEQSMLGDGLLVEAGSEQAFVSGLDAGNLAVHRGVRGTEPDVHLAGTEVLIAPAYTRTAAFVALRDAIRAMTPPLYTFASEVVEVGRDGVTLVPDDALLVTRARSLSCHEDVPLDDLGTWPDSTGELKRSVRLFNTSGQALVTYRSKLGLAESENDLVADLGLRPEWERLAVVGMVAQLIASRPMSVAQQEHVASMLRTEGYPVETPTRLRDALVRYHEYLVQQAANGLVAEDQQRVMLV